MLLTGLIWLEAGYFIAAKDYWAAAFFVAGAVFCTFYNCLYMPEGKRK